MIPRRADGGPLRIAHRVNTLAELEAGASGLDGVELDVIAGRDGPVLAHSPHELAPGAPTLAAALDLLGDAIVLVDLKQAGIEAEVVGALRGRLERSIVCSLDARSLRAVRRLDPGLRTSLSYPADRLRVSKRGLPAPILGAAAATLRLALPFRIERMLLRAQADAATLNHLVLSRRTVTRCHARGAAVIAWTVNDPEDHERVTSLGVDAVVTDDPSVFAPATIATPCGA